ncbi:MAG: hypothetical protein E7A37_06165 [Negativicoccus succinicivorans]|nr:hypothetical protein [Negativicoccus succinicivorans]
MNLERFDKYQQQQIQFGLEEGLDVKDYADPKFNADQMREIRYGLEKDLDASIYADPKNSWRQMKQMRLNLENGLKSQHDRPAVQLNKPTGKGLER